MLQRNEFCTPGSLVSWSKDILMDFGWLPHIKSVLTNLQTDIFTFGYMTYKMSVNISRFQHFALKYIKKKDGC